MTLCQDIIAQLDQDKPQQPLPTWSSLSLEDKYCLLREARRRSEDSDASMPFFGALYRMVEKEEPPWSALEVCACAIRRPSSVDRARVLKKMRELLDQIRKTLPPSDSAAIDRFKQHTAGYLVLCGKVWSESDQIPRAIQSYQEALRCYQEQGADEGAQWVQKQISRLQQIQGSRGELLPMELLESERARVQEELARLETGVEKQQQVLADSNIDHQRLQDDQRRLLRQIEEQKTKLQEQGRQTKQKDARLQEIDDQVRQWEATLHFLMALPRAAMAPLWVPVVRLALDQGEIDDLTLRALERLAIDAPEDAVPLLAEIAARHPDPSAVDLNRLQKGVVHWMAGIARARSSQKENPTAAAQALVDAWDAFFAPQERVHA